MKIVNIVYYVLILLCFSFVRGHEITVLAVDEGGGSVSDADVVVSFIRPVRGSSLVHRGKTNDDGVFQANDEILMGAFLKVSKDGFYAFEKRSGFSPADHTIRAVLREVREPRSLYVREAKISVPVMEQEIGFDLALGDWVGSYGVGQVSDFFVEMTKRYGGLVFSGKKWEKIKLSNPDLSDAEMREIYGKWDAKVKITFPNGGGAAELEEEFIPYSQLKLPHSAPKEGYLSALELMGSTYGQSTESSLGGYFLRTRVRRNGEEIVGAHFAKIYGGIDVDARGEISFLYYFNPVENDRNLEFNPEENLANGQTRTFYP